MFKRLRACALDPVGDDSLSVVYDERSHGLVLLELLPQRPHGTLQRVLVVVRDDAEVLAGAVLADDDSFDGRFLDDVCAARRSSVDAPDHGCHCVLRAEHGGVRFAR
jgi:hypothetical protein